MFFHCAFLLDSKEYWQRLNKCYANSVSNNIFVLLSLKIISPNISENILLKLIYFLSNCQKFKPNLSIHICFQLCVKQKNFISFVRKRVWVSFYELLTSWSSETVAYLQVLANFICSFENEITFLIFKLSKMNFLRGK